MNIIPRPLLCLALCLGASVCGLGALPAPAGAVSYVRGEVVVGYAPAAGRAVADAARRIGARTVTAQSANATTGTGPGSATIQRVLRLPSGASVARAAARLRRQPGVAYAVPDYIAHAAGAWIPDDPGRGTTISGWERVQWNFLPTTGINAPEAWANLISDHRPGAGGVIVAILDTGIAYRNWHQFGRSPDFTSTRFVSPYDFVADNRYPLDREGHGTFVTGTIAESTNNGVSLAGLAYGASIMPVRILDAQGNGDATTIARGIRYAVAHGAAVINLSLEFGLDVTASEIPEIISALRLAHQRGVTVVAAAGNDSGSSIAYPARDTPAVISVGATTRDRCLANYSNTGAHLELVAPGGGNDAQLAADPNCHPSVTLPDISQVTFYNASAPRRFGLPGGWYGTSMSAPHVAAAAAMVIASGVIGRHPTPDQILARLEQTAQPLGQSVPNLDYGYGLVDAGAATRPPLTPPATTIPAPTAR